MTSIGELSIDIIFNQSSIEKSVKDLERRFANYQIAITPVINFDKNSIERSLKEKLAGIDLSRSIKIGNSGIFDSNQANSAIQESSEDFADKLAASLQKATNQAVSETNPLSNIFNTLISNATTGLTADLGKGITNAIEKAISPSIGSFEFLGESLVNKGIPLLGKALEGKLSDTLGKGFVESFKKIGESSLFKTAKDKLNEEFVKAVGETELFVAKKSVEVNNKNKDAAQRKVVTKELRNEYAQALEEEPINTVQRVSLEGRKKNLTAEKNALIENSQGKELPLEDLAKLNELNDELNEIDKTLEKLNFDFADLEEKIRKVSNATKGLDTSRGSFQELREKYQGIYAERVTPVELKLEQEQARAKELEETKQKYRDQSREYVDYATQTEDPEVQKRFIQRAKDIVSVINSIDKEIEENNQKIADYSEVIQTFNEAISTDYAKAKLDIEVERLKIGRNTTKQQIGLVTSGLNTLQETNDSTKQKVTEVSQQREKANDNLTEKKSRAETLDAEIDLINIQKELVDSASEEYKEFDLALGTLTAELGEVKAEIGTLNTEIGTLDRVIEVYSSLMEESGKQLSLQKQKLSALNETLTAQAETITEKTTTVKQAPKQTQEVTPTAPIKVQEEKPAAPVQPFAPENDYFQFIVNEVLKKSNYEGNLKIPQLKAYTQKQQEFLDSDPNTSFIGGQYDSKSNTIYARPETVDKLRSGTLDQDELGLLVHELRHAIQSNFGDIDLREQENQKLNYYTPNSEEAKKLAYNIESSSSVADVDKQPLARKYETDAYTFSEREASRIFASLDRQVALRNFEQVGGSYGGRADKVIYSNSKTALDILNREAPLDADPQEVLDKFYKRLDAVNISLEPVLEKARSIDILPTDQIRELTATLDEKLSMAITQIAEIPSEVLKEIRYDSEKEFNDTRDTLLSSHVNLKRTLLPIIRKYNIPQSKNGEKLSKSELVDSLLEQVPLETIQGELRGINPVSEASRQKATARAELPEEKFREVVTNNRDSILAIVKDNKPKSVQNLQNIAGIIQQEYEVLDHALTLDLSEDIKNFITGTKLTYDKVRKGIERRIINNLNSQAQQNNESDVQTVGVSGLPGFNINNSLESLKNYFQSKSSNSNGGLDEEFEKLKNNLGAIESLTDEQIHEILIELESIPQLNAGEAIKSTEQVAKAVEKIQGIFNNIAEQEKYLQETARRVQQTEESLGIGSVSKVGLVLPDSIRRVVYGNGEQENPDQKTFRQKRQEKLYSTSANIASQGQRLFGEIGTLSEDQRVKGEEGIANELDAVKRKLGDDITEINKILSEGVTDEGFKKLGDLNASIRGVFNQFNENIAGDTTNVLDVLKDAFTNAGTAVKGFISTALGFVAFNVVTSTITNLLPTLRQAAIDFDQINIGLKFVSGSATLAQQKFEYLSQESKRLGTDFKTSANAYTTLASSTLDTPLEGRQTDDIFRGVQEAAAARQLPTEQTNSALLALDQIAGKTVVSMQELRLQLGQALPGSAQVAARSLGLTSQEFNKLVESGTLLAEDFLPKFSSELSAQAAIALPEALDSYTAATNRYKNSVENLQASLGKPLIDFEKSGLNQFSQGLDVLAAIMPNIITLTIGLAAEFSLKLGGSLLTAAANFGLIEAGMTGVLTIGRALLPVITTLGSRFILFTAIVEVFKILKGVISDNAEELTKMNDVIQISLDRYDALNKKFSNRNAPAKQELPPSAIVDKSFLSFLPKSVDKDNTNFFNSLGYNIRKGITGAEYAYEETTTGTNFGKVYAGDQKIQGQRANELAQNTSDRINEVLSSGNGALSQVKQIDAELDQLNLKRRGLSETALQSPENAGQIRDIEKQEDTLLAKRNEAAKPIAALQEETEISIKSLKEQIKYFDDLASKPGEYQRDYQNISQTLTQSLAVVQKQQENLNHAIREGVDAYALFGQRIQLVIDRLADSKTLITSATNSAKQNIYNEQIAGKVSSTQAGFLSGQVDIQALEAEIKATHSALVQSASLLNERLSTLSAYNLSTKSGQAEITTAANSANDKDKPILERFASYKGLEQTYSDLKTQLTQSQAQVAEQLKQTAKEFTQFYREMQFEAASLANETKSIANSIAVDQAKSKLRSALVGNAETFVNGYVDTLVNIVDEINKPLQDYLQKVQQLAQARNEALQKQQNLIDIAEKSTALLQGQTPTINGYPTQSQDIPSNKIGRSDFYNSRDTVYSPILGGGGERNNQVASTVDEHHSGGHYHERLYNGKREEFRNDGGSFDRLVKDITLDQPGRGQLNADVPSPVGGRVQLLSDPKGYGNYVNITDPNGGTLARLAHLNRYAPGLKDGDYVKPGQIVGQQGSTGDAQGIHVHLEIPANLFAPYFNALKTGDFSALSGSQPSGTQSQIITGNNSTQLYYKGGKQKIMGNENAFILKDIPAPLQAFANTVVLNESNQSQTPRSYYSKNGAGFFNPQDAVGKFPSGDALSGGINIGRYQFNEDDYNTARRSNKNIVGFTPQEQDLIYIEKLKQRGILQPLLSGDIHTALVRAGAEWSSLPTSNLRGGAERAKGFTEKDYADFYYKNLAAIQGGGQAQQNANQTQMQQQGVSAPSYDSSANDTTNNNAQAYAGINTQQLQAGNKQIIDNYATIRKNIQDQLASANKLAALQVKIDQEKARDQLIKGLDEQEQQVKARRRKLEDITKDLGQPTLERENAQQNLEVSRNYEDEVRGVNEDYRKLTAARNELTGAYAVINEGNFPGSQFLKQQLPLIKEAITRTTKQLDETKKQKDRIDSVYALKLKDIDIKYKKALSDRARELNYTDYNQEAARLDQAANEAEAKQKGDISNLSFGDPIKLRSQAQTLKNQVSISQAQAQLDQTLLTNPNAKEQIQNIRTRLDQLKVSQQETVATKLQTDLENRQLEIEKRALDIQSKSNEYDQQKNELLASRAELYLKANPYDYAQGNPDKIRLQSQIDTSQYNLDSQVLQARTLAHQIGLSSEETKKWVDNLKDLDSLRLDNLRRQLQEVERQQLIAVRNRRNDYQGKVDQADIDQLNTEGDTFSGEGLTYFGNQKKKQASILANQKDYESQVQGIYDYGKANDLGADQIQVLLDKLEKLNNLKLDNIKKQFDPLREVGTSAVGALQTSIESLITNGFGNFGDVFMAFGQTVTQTLTKIASEWVSNEIVRSLFGINNTGTPDINGKEPSYGSGGFANGAFSGILKIFGGGSKNSSGGGLLGGLGSLLGGGGGGSDDDLFGGLSDLLGFSDGGMVPVLAGMDSLRKSDHPIGKALRQEGGTSVLAALTPGERVLNTKQTKLYDTVFPKGIDYQYKKNIPIFNSGGIVGNVSIPALQTASGASSNQSISVNTPVKVESQSHQEKLLSRYAQLAVISELKRQSRPGGLLDKT